MRTVQVNHTHAAAAHGALYVSVRILAWYVKRVGVVCLFLETRSINVSNVFFLHTATPPPRTRREPRRTAGTPIVS